MRTTLKTDGGHHNDGILYGEGLEWRDEDFAKNDDGSAYF
jgi:hypothetical protein